MKKIKINSFIDLHKVIANYQSKTIIYRGLKSIGFGLIPKLGRIIPRNPSREVNEKEILRLFKERALPYLDFTPVSDWDWLAIGQHHGLPTRLLDWTRNPLVSIP